MSQYPAEAAARAEMVRIGRLLHQKEYVDGNAGNLSARLGPERILVTPAGLAKGFLQPEQMLVIDLAGNVAAPAPPGLRPTSETLMHLEAYRRRPDVNGVVHAHPITSVALSIAGVSLAECVIPESVVILGLVPTLPYATPSSVENQNAIHEAILGHDALILKNHGTLTVGPTLWDAYLKLETLEHTARTIALAKLLGGTPALPPEQAFCEACGVCHAPGAHLAPQAPAPARNGDDEARVRRIAEDVRRQLKELGITS